jgi:ABC-type lipoprotein release transport system permease subunit
MVSTKNISLFSFAWKSMKRNPGRVVFVSLCVSLAVIAALWIYAFIRGFGSAVENAVVTTNTGYFQFQEPHYAKTTDSSFPYIFHSDLAEKLKFTTKSYSPELVLDGNVVTPEGATALKALGIVPELHQNFMPLPSKMIEGAFLTTGDDDQIVIGQELATFFKLHSGEQLVLNYQDHKGELSSEILIIKGIFHFNSRSFEKHNLYMTQRTWQKLFFRTIGPDILFNRIPVMTKDLSVRKALEETFRDQPLVLKSWKEMNPEMAVVNEFQMIIIQMFFIIVGFAVILTILNPVQMAWQERMKELKLLTILGMSPRDIWTIGFYEVVLMTTVSGLTAVLVLGVVLGVQSKTGVDFSSMNQGVHIERGGIIMPRHIYPSMDFIQVVEVFLSVSLIFCLSYAYAINGALKKLRVEI